MTEQKITGEVWVVLGVTVGCCPGCEGDYCQEYAEGTPVMFTNHGIAFRLERSGKWWQLYYQRKSGRWESLSIWSTKAEAREAAGRFVPSPSFT